jgi:hypothetical protein
MINNNPRRICDPGGRVNETQDDQNGGDYYN